MWGCCCDGFGLRRFWDVREDLALRLQVGGAACYLLVQSKLDVHGSGSGGLYVTDRPVDPLYCLYCCRPPVNCMRLPERLLPGRSMLPPRGTGCTCETQPQQQPAAICLGAFPVCTPPAVRSRCVGHWKPAVVAVSGRHSSACTVLCLPAKSELIISVCCRWSLLPLLPAPAPALCRCSHLCSTPHPAHLLGVSEGPEPGASPREQMASEPATPQAAFGRGASPAAARCSWWLTKSDASAAACHASGAKKPTTI